MVTLTGNKLAALLKERGMSQKELAEAASLTPTSVSRYINGDCLHRQKNGVKNLSVWPNANCSGTTQALTLIVLYICHHAFTS